ncbi:hypothetical protein PORCRE_2075 [Porphyromonas crevioricanis JCM 15906]|uniref:Uncharacterized protein n=1 Tax=Porphyromonas crevioricanis JCM 15906 TaxID=1305617 RepID=T1CR75_9PORP|nr:hypothetical protein PORCRE_2075 [Porphyromonas crevioricanis JCM 15906]
MEQKQSEGPLELIAWALKILLKQSLGWTLWNVLRVGLA